MKSSGMTLLEIIFLLIILSCCFYLTTLSFNRHEEKIIQDELKMVLDYAQLLALHHRQPLILKPLHPSFNWAQGAVLTDRQGKKIIYQWQWQHRHWVMDWQGLAAKPYLVFSPNPLNSLNNGRFILSHVTSKRKYSFIINRLGRIRLELQAQVVERASK